MARHLVIYAALFLTAAANAQPDAGIFEITPYGAYSFGGTFNDSETGASVALKNSANAGLILNFRESANTQWEVLYSLQPAEADVTGITTTTSPLDIDVHYLQAGGTYQADGDRVRPYLAATVGAAHYDVKTEGFDSDTFFSFSIGTGLQLRPNDRLGLRLEARLFGTFLNSDSTLFCVSDPGGGTAGCAFTVTGEILWQVQTMAGVVFRF